MKKLFSLLIFILVLFFSPISIAQINNNWPSQDIWAFIQHDADPWGKHPKMTVFVHIPKDSLSCDEHNCPAEDVKVIGEATYGNTSLGWHVITIKKGTFNNPKSYFLNPPKNKPKFKPDNIHTWIVSL